MVGVQLCLNARLDDIERARQDTGHAACCSGRSYLKANPNVEVANPFLCPVALLLVDCELDSGKREVAKNGRFITIVEGFPALSADDGAESIEGRAVVVAGVGEFVVVAPLELKSGFEDFGWDVYE